jgi:hypothetical protein
MIGDRGVVFLSVAHGLWWSLTHFSGSITNTPSPLMATRTGRSFLVKMASRTPFGGCSICPRKKALP